MAPAQILQSEASINHSPAPVIELVCSVRSVAGLRAAIDQGADSVRIECSSPNSTGVQSLVPYNDGVARGVRYAHDNSRKAVLGLDIQSNSSNWTALRAIIDRAALAGIDAVLLSDPALLLYATMKHPGVHLHYRPPVDIFSAKAVDLIHAQLGVSRILLPSVLSLKQLQAISHVAAVEIEIGEIAQSPGLQRRSTRNPGPAEAPPDKKRIHEQNTNEYTQYCSSEQSASNEACYDLSCQSAYLLELLPQVADMGVCAVTVKAEGHDSRRAARLTRVWRDAIDNFSKDRRQSQP